MTDYKFDNCPVTNGVLTTSYTYGTSDKEYVFSCKGRPFAALVSPNLPTPTSTLLDYDLIRKLHIKMTDVQCRKFQFGGHKMRILGRVSSAVQCVQGGRITGSFHIKGLVVTDLYEQLDTHCVAGTKMRERIAQYDKDLAANLADTEDDDMVIPEMTSSSSAPVGTMTRSSSSLVGTMTSSSSSPVGTTTSSPSSLVSMTTSSTSSPVGMTTSSPMTTMAKTPSMTSSASAKMTPYVSIQLTKGMIQDAETRATWVTSPSRLKVPDEANLFSATYDQEGHGCQEWLDNCYNENEGETLKQSMIDGRPRVINLHEPDMLRVGDWGRLEDPYKHQYRHMHLARIRRAEPDRVCVFCNYSLGHKCDLYCPATVTHCSECCVHMQYKNYDMGWRGDPERVERLEEGRRRGTGGHENL